MTMTTEAATLMKEKIRALTMQDIAGEDVHRAATLIRGTVKRLEMIDDVPVDLPKQIIAKFVRVFSTIESLHTVGGFTGGVVYDVSTLVAVAESTYVKMSTVWNVDPADNPPHLFLKIKSKSHVGVADKKVTLLVTAHARPMLIKRKVSTKRGRVGIVVGGIIQIIPTTIMEVGRTRTTILPIIPAIAPINW